MTTKARRLTIECSQLAKDGKPLDYVDDEGTQWAMCACGHRAGGGVRVGNKMALCPNCAFLARSGRIPVVYPDRLPGDMMEVTQ